jgi:Spy/CpxP family protein refolding chaperone
MWTLTDDDNDIINVRAILSTVHQQDQIRNLITALEQRLPKEPPHDRDADVRRSLAASPGRAEEAEAETGEAQGTALIGHDK